MEIFVTFGGISQTFGGISQPPPKEGERTRRFVFETSPVTIGRSPNNDIQIRDALVSRRHCLLYHHEQTILLHDISATGVWIDNDRISGPWFLDKSEVAWFSNVTIQVIDSVCPKPDLRKGLAKNPDLPIDFLFALGALYPKDFLQNPLLPLLLLENPDFWKRVPEHTMRAILTLQDEILPIEVLQGGAIHSSWHVRNAVALHKNTPKSLLLSLGQDSDPHVRQSAIENPNAPSDLLQTILQSKKQIV